MNVLCGDDRHDEGRGAYTVLESRGTNDANILLEAVQRSIALAARLQLPSKDGQGSHREAIIELERRAFVADTREHRRPRVIEEQQRAS